MQVWLNHFYLQTPSVSLTVLLRGSCGYFPPCGVTEVQDVVLLCARLTVNNSIMTGRDFSPLAGENWHTQQPYGRRRFTPFLPDSIIRTQTKAFVSADDVVAVMTQLCSLPGPKAECIRLCLLVWKYKPLMASPWPGLLYRNTIHQITFKPE